MLIRDNQKQIIQYIGYGILALITASLILAIWLPFGKSFRIVFGSFYVLFLPGLVLSYAFFEKIDIIERITLSFALSIAIVPLLVFYLNLLGMKITLLNTFLVVAFVALIGGLVIWRKM